MDVDLVQNRQDDVERLKVIEADLIAFDDAGDEESE